MFYSTVTITRICFILVREWAVLSILALKLFLCVELQCGHSNTVVLCRGASVFLLLPRKVVQYPQKGHLHFLSQWSDTLGQGASNPHRPHRLGAARPGNEPAHYLWHILHHWAVMIQTPDTVQFSKPEQYLMLTYPRRLSYICWFIYTCNPGSGGIWKSVNVLKHYQKCFHHFLH